MSDTSNIDALAANLLKTADCLDLTLRSGKDLLAHIADNIASRAGAEHGPNGDWAENRGRYGEKKQNLDLSVGKGLKDSAERMLSLPQIKGKQVITHDEASMAFGTDDVAAKLGQWFTAGSTATEDAETSGAKNQPARPFYVMTEINTSPAPARRSARRSRSCSRSRSALRSRGRYSGRSQGRRLGQASTG